MPEGGWITRKTLLPAGRYFLQGDEACAEGAIAAGCNYYAGYPITPASEIMHYICRRFLELDDGRVFIQMEDEIGSIASCIGASWAGAKAMTATSGPGISLMLENIGYAIMTETPVVVVDVQRAGPATGQATRPAQGDVMQLRWGAHGDYEIIVLAPWSVQEMFDLTLRAFNLAEKFRVPVIVAADEAVGHMRENLIIPPEVEVYERIKPLPGENIPPFGGVEVPPMPIFGRGHKVLVTGSTHDEWGYRRTVSARAQASLISRFREKILNHLVEIVQVDRRFCDGDIDVLVFAYGFTARSALAAVKEARKRGIKAALFRPQTLWPFPEQELLALKGKVDKVLVAEMNQGQILREVQRFLPQAVGYNRTDGEVITPSEVLEAIEKLLGRSANEAA
ncbi:MAG: 2-oxoacid:acceptor oxidoreductase subunit alpha [Anaerolineae bacterium]|nr:2-oxoacid:acceptor oxidoreductase subunit alpha [Anaerolineae bacterium]